MCENTKETSKENARRRACSLKEDNKRSEELFLCYFVPVSGELGKKKITCTKYTSTLVNNKVFV
jgi:hypothetical protein